MKKVLVTGSSGFVGKSLTPALAENGWSVGALGRTPEDWKGKLVGAEAIIHLGARVHRLDESGAQAEAAFDRDNAVLTRNLAEAAVAAGVRRFVFLSSVKAMGDSTPGDVKFDENSRCDPQDAYGRSKLKAEEAVLNLESKEFEPVVLRAPLVYGPGVKANMASLFRVVARGVPLPFANIRNARSFIYVGNLVDAILACLERQSLPGNRFLLSDGEDLSTPELIRRIAGALERPARLFPFPQQALRAAAVLAGRISAVDRLTGSLRVDSSKFRRSFGWSPPHTVDEGLKETALWLSRR